MSSPQTVIVANPADWIVIVVMIVIAVCTVTDYMAQRRLRKEVLAEFEAHQATVKAAVEELRANHAAVRAAIDEFETKARRWP